jgi:hypothetical protein
MQENRKDVEIHDLKMQNEKGAVERDEFVTKLKEASDCGHEKRESEMKDQEIAKLKTALNEVGGQLDVTNEDLEAESLCKSRIFELLQFQTLLFTQPENLL